MGKIEVSCLCGDVRIEVEPPVISAGHCHCDNCRRAHGAAFWTWVTFPRDRARVVSGEPVRYTQEDTKAVRSFCGRCGTTLVYENPRTPEEVDVSLANVDGTVEPGSMKRLFADRTPPWDESRDGLPRFGGPDGKQPL